MDTSIGEMNKKRVTMTVWQPISDWVAQVRGTPAAQEALVRLAVAGVVMAATVSVIGVVFNPGTFFWVTLVVLLWGVLVIGQARSQQQALRAGADYTQLQSAHVTLQEAMTALQKSNTKLQQQIQDGEIELEATVDEFNRAKEEADQAKDEAEKSKEEAERANTIKSAFLASMSHELRTPLNSIINFTRFVVDGDTGPINEQQKELLGEVVTSGKHLLNLINDVLDMSKIEAGSLRLFVEDQVNLNAILDSAATTGRSLLVDKPVRLVMAAEDGLPTIRCDRQRVLQILLNIISNACKFTPEGEITVRAHVAGDEVIISVADQGAGIAPEDQPAVFEAFKQTKTGLRQGGGGTGLGMPIARNLAEAHGGRLWLESEPGKGATFYVALPIQSEGLLLTLV